MNRNPLCRLAVLLLVIPSSLYAQQQTPTVSPPPKVVRYVAPLFGLSANPCLPMSVRLNVKIGIEGEVKEIKVVSGPPGLRQPVTEAVRLWLFEPSIINGMPAQVLTEVEVPNMPPEAKCELKAPSDSFSFRYLGVQGQTISLDGVSAGCGIEGCWIVRHERGVGGPVNGGPLMLFRQRSETRELEFKCRARECTLKNSSSSATPSYSQKLKFDESGLIPTSVRVTFTVTK